MLQYVFGYAVVRLGDVATKIYRGSGITREQVTTDGISCVRYGEIYTTYGVWFDKCKSHTQISEMANPKYFEHGDILFAITGESVEDIAKSTAYVGNDKCLAGGDIVVLKHNQNPKYLAYALSTHDAQKQKSKGKIKSKVVHSSVPAISEITIPLPSLSEQERIVKILDRFDSLCNDISSGLPAEIEARKKQYEYYRDKLLSFPHCS
nr:restriction endonuclease subunit S [Treponema succinifaciens]